MDLKIREVLFHLVFPSTFNLQHKRVNTMKILKSIASIFTVVALTSNTFASDEPMIFSTIEGAATGIVSKRVIREAYYRLGINVQIISQPGKESLSNANNGFVDGELFRIAGMETEYTNLIPIPVPVDELEGMAFSLNNSDISVNDWESLKPYRVGIQRGVKFAEKNTRHMAVNSVTKNTELFEMINSKEIDVAVMARLNGLKSLNDSKITTTTAIEPPLIKAPLYHYVNKKHAKLVPQLTKVLQEMQNEGIMKKYRQQVIVELLEI